MGHLVVRLKELFYTLQYLTFVFVKAEVDMFFRGTISLSVT